MFINFNFFIVAYTAGLNSYSMGRRIVQPRQNIQQGTILDCGEGQKG